MPSHKKKNRGNHTAEHPASSSLPANTPTGPQAMRSSQASQQHPKGIEGSKGSRGGKPVEAALVSGGQERVTINGVAWRPRNSFKNKRERMAYEESRRVAEPIDDSSLAEQTVPPTTIETIPTDPDQNYVQGESLLNPEATAYDDVPSVLAPQDNSAYSGALNTTSSAVQRTSGPWAYPVPGGDAVNPQHLARYGPNDPTPPQGVHVELSRCFSSNEEVPDGHSSICLGIQGYAGGMGGMPIRSGQRADRHNVSMVAFEFTDTSGNTERLEYPVFRDDSVNSLTNTFQSGSWFDPSSSHHTSG